MNRFNLYNHGFRTGECRVLSLERYRNQPVLLVVYARDPVGLFQLNRLEHLEAESVCGREPGGESRL